jgi:agmatine deiminase
MSNRLQAGPSQRFRMLPDWAEYQATLLAWPGVDTACGRAGRDLLALYDRIIRLLREVHPVRLLVAPDELDHISRLLGGEDESLHLEPLLTNDIWMRDAGPISALDENGTAVFLDGNFNGWGHKYPHELDRLIPLLLARRWGMTRIPLPVTIEGGAIEVNGSGDLLTTASVVLNPNRANPDRAESELLLKACFGVERVHWLERGLSGDDTDGHIDNLARFVTAKRIVHIGTDVARDHPDRTVLLDNRARLERLKLHDEPPELIALPAPEVIREKGRVLPASYTNYYRAGGLVLVPQFGDNGDQEALGILSEVFPDHRVEGLDARALLIHGGTFHCITQPLHLN